MECVDITSMSSRGQVVIPQRLRDKLGLIEGEKFIVIGEDGTLIFKKIDRPSKEELLKKLDALTEKTKNKVKKSGIKESDVLKIIHKRRGIN
jgi:AbrB family looped-hinge helix DNA binding protein